MTAQQPEAQRSIQRFEVVDCIDDKHVPAVIPKPHGPWVRYEDHIAALAAGQATAAPAQPAAQQGVAYAALPEPHFGEGRYLGLAFRSDAYSVAQVQALFASHGQAPATPQADGQPALDRTRIREIFMTHGFTVKEGQTDLKQYVYDAADALLRAARAPADSVTAPAGGVVAAHRVMRKRLDGEWVCDGRYWCDGPPSQELVESICADKDRWRVDVAYTAPPAQAADSVGRDADRIEKWSDRIQRAHPKSEPEFWPDALRVKYMADEISDLRAASAPADSVLEDAARYRWLRDQAHPDSEDSGIAVSESDFNDWGNKFTRYYSGEELDAAIDAAMNKGASHAR